MSKPLLICMTPVRNEAWVLYAFLHATSIWADYIIIADQQSTDGSREIALSFPKVILIDNNNPEFNEADRQKLLIDKAREIKGDKILVGLDADEIFAANFKETADWQIILNSVPGDVFWFRWANICANQNEYWSPETFYPWMFHDDGIEPHGNYVRNMHSMRIPYPIDEKQMFYVNNFNVLHLAYLYPNRIGAKIRFYKLVDYEMNKLSSVVLSRTYQQNIILDKTHLLPMDWIYSSDVFEFDLFSLINIKDNDFWFDKYILKHFEENGILKYKNIDIWNKSFLEKYGIIDPRSFWIKIIHLYFQKTKKISRLLIIRAVDKILKKVMK